MRWRTSARPGRGTHGTTLILSALSVFLALVCVVGLNVGGSRGGIASTGEAPQARSRVAHVATPVFTSRREAPASASRTPFREDRGGGFEVPFDERKALTPDEWRYEMESAASALLRGSVTLDDVAELTARVLAGIDEREPRGLEEGALGYTLFEDLELGSSVLRVRPDRPGSVELESELKRPVGGWEPGETDGSRLILRFDLDRAGAVTAFHGTLQTSVRADVLSSPTARAGPLPKKGAMLFATSEGVTWSAVKTSFTATTKGRHG